MIKMVDRVEAIGWLFWIAAFVVLAVPCTYGVWQFKFQDTSGIKAIVIGALLAAVLSAFITYAANAALQSYKKKQRVQKRKKAKKRK